MQTNICTHTLTHTLVAHARTCTHAHTHIHTQAELTKQQNEFKIKLKELEDSLLSRLSSAGGNFLGDTSLVENLETTKRTATEVQQKVRILSVPANLLATDIHLETMLHVANPIADIVICFLHQSLRRRHA